MSACTKRDISQPSRNAFTRISSSAAVQSVVAGAGADAVGWHSIVGCDCERGSHCSVP